MIDLTDHPDNPARNLIEFPRAKPEDEAVKEAAGPAAIAARGKGIECRHHGVTVDKSARTLVCSRCGCDVDPIAYIAHLAVSWDHKRWSVRQDFKAERWARAWFEAGGKLSIRPGSVVATMGGKTWTTSTWADGFSSRVISVLERAQQDGAFEPEPKAEAARQ